MVLFERVKAKGKRGGRKGKGVNSDQLTDVPAADCMMFAYHSVPPRENARFARRSNAFPAETLGLSTSSAQRDRITVGLK